MIYTLTDFICLDISILLAFLMFYISDFINNCMPKVDIITNPNLALCQYQIFSPGSPNRKRPSFRTHA